MNLSISKYKDIKKTEASHHKRDALGFRKTNRGNVTVKFKRLLSILVREIVISTLLPQSNTNPRKINKQSRCRASTVQRR